jgi:hypothetical protein
VRVTRTQISGAAGEIGSFQAGSKARISVTMEAAAAVEKVAVVVQLFNADFYDVFHTSSQRLGHPPVSLRAGEKADCEFDVDLHLGPGTYYLGVYLYRYDREQQYDHIFPATSFVITADRDSRGAANLYPVVARCHVWPGISDKSDLLLDVDRSERRMKNGSLEPPASLPSGRLRLGNGAR